ncbi:MAG: hypothetical protein SPE85_02495 [Prevotella sp.]|nr:hypothetical protein [Prevotella sp.]
MAFFLVLSSVWIVWAAAIVRPAMVHGRHLFHCGHVPDVSAAPSAISLLRGRAHCVMRRIGHISIHGMTACSYPPICVSVLGGAVSWTVFAILWRQRLRWLQRGRTVKTSPPAPVS